jgi:hypothetical protein
MNRRYSEMWSRMDSQLVVIPRKSELKWNTASSGCYETPSGFSSQSAGYSSSDETISIAARSISMLLLDELPITVSLDGGFWYVFNGFLHVEKSVVELFFSAKKLLDERWPGLGVE